MKHPAQCIGCKWLNGDLLCSNKRAKQHLAYTNDCWYRKEPDWNKVAGSYTVTKVGKDYFNIT